MGFTMYVYLLINMFTYFNAGDLSTQDKRFISLQSKFVYFVTLAILFYVF